MPHLMNDDTRKTLEKIRCQELYLSHGLIIDQLVGFLVVEPAHSGLSPRFGTCAHISLDLFQDLTALCFQW
jgi:hypothetical protein